VLRVADIAVKLAMVALLVSSVLYPDLTGIKQRAAPVRLVVYPIGALAMPAWWWIVGRRRRQAHGGVVRFPWGADLLVTLPWFLDTFGNRLNLFDTISWFDDMMHFLNWLLLTLGVLLAWVPGSQISRGMIMMCGLGFGTTAAVAWEVGEYLAFIRNTPGLQAYRDTLGDLTLGTLGSIVASTSIAIRHRPVRIPGPSERDANQPSAGRHAGAG
jgi:hypothetical protein